MNSVIKIFTVFILITYSTSITKELIRHNSFFAYPNDSLHLNTNTFNICLKNFSENTNYITLSDKSVDDISQFINLESLSVSVMDSNEILSSKRIFSNASNNYVGIDLVDVVLDDNTYYCIKFSSLKRLDTLRNFAISAVGGFPDGIIYNELKPALFFNYYTLQQSGILVSKSDVNLLEATISDVFTNTLHLETAIPKFKIIHKSNVLIRITYSDNIVLPKDSDISFEDSDDKNMKKLEFINKYVEGNQILLSDFSEDLHLSRGFIVKVSNLKFKSNIASSNIEDNYCFNSPDNYTIKVDLLWKNSNSLISTTNRNIGIKCSKFKFYDSSLTEMNNFPILYTSTSWPLTLKFRVNATIIDKTLELSIGDDIDIIGQFLPSTCSLLGMTTSSFCSTKRNQENKVFIKNVNLESNELFTLNIWISLNRISNKFSFDSTKYKFYIEFFGLTEKTIISNTPNVIRPETCFKYSMPPAFPIQLLSTDPSPKNGECFDTINSCITKVFVKENTKNFYLLRGEPLEKTFIQSFQNSLTAPFILRFENDDNGFSSFNSGWALELGDNTFNINNIIKGTHKFYFPSKYVNITFPTANSRIKWKSNSYATTENLENGETLINSFNVFPIDTIAENKIHFNQAIVEGNSIDKNVVSINNYNNDKINLGLFMHLNFAFTKKTENDSEIINVKAPLNNQNTVKIYYISDDKVQHDIQFDFVNLKQTNISNIHEPFELIEAFHRKSDGKIIRINRFVTLIPKGFIFEKTEMNNNESIIKNSLLFTSNTVHNSVSLLEIDLTSAIENNTENNILMIFFNNMTFIEFENMNLYPASGVSTVGVFNNYSKPSSYNIIYSEETPYDVDLVTLGSRIEVKLTNTLQSKIIIPYQTKIIYTESTNIHEIIQIEYSNKLYSKVKQYKTYDSNLLTNNLSKNGIIQWNFVKNSYRLNYKDISVEREENSNDKSKYLVILSNFSLSKNTKILFDISVDNNNFISNSTQNYYQVISLNNPFIYNGIKYNNMLSFYNENSSESFTSKVRDENNKLHSSFNIFGADLPLKKLNESKINLNVLDFNILMNTDDTKISESNSITFNDTLEEISTNLNNIVTVKVLTSGIRTSQNFDENSYICVSFNIISKFYSDRIVINLLNNITNRTIYKSMNFNGIVNTLGQSIEIKNELNNSTKLTFIACNMMFNADNPITIQKIEYFSGDKLLESMINDSGVLKINSSINSLSYTSAVVSNIQFDDNDITYDTMTMTIDFNHEIFRNMRVEIHSNIISNLNTSENIEINCYARFKTPGIINKIFKSCKILDNIIAIETINDVLVGNLPISFEVVLFPILFDDNKFPSLEFKVYESFIGGEKIFGNKSSNPSILSSRTKNSLLVLSNFFVNSLNPFLPGIRGYFELEIEEANNKILIEHLNNKQITINEISLFFPNSYYGTIKTSTYLECYINKRLIQNCVEEGGWISIRDNLSFIQTIKIEIYGFEIPIKTYLDSSKTEFLFKFNKITHIKKETIVHGIGKVRDSFITNFLTKFTYPFLNKSNENISISESASENYQTFNLALIENKNSLKSMINSENSVVNSIADIELSYTIDSLNGISGNNLNLSNINDAIIYIEIPYNLSFSINSDIKIKLQKIYVQENANENTDVNYNETEELEISLDEKEKIGKLIKCKISSESAINNSFKKIVFTLTSIQTINSSMFSDEELREGLFIVNINKFGVFNISTMTLLQIDNFTSEKLLNKKGMITNFKSRSYEFMQNRFYFNYKQQNFKPGVFNKLEINVVNNFKVMPDNNSIMTDINLTVEKGVFFTPENTEYIVNGGLKNRIIMEIGSLCEVIPGKYLLLLKHSDVNNLYSQFPILYANIDNKSVKEQVQFFTSELQLYLSKSTIVTPMEGIYFFFAKTTLPSTSQISVEFNIENSAFSGPKKIVIPAYNNEYIKNEFRYISAIPGAVQIYNINISGNDCFSSISTIMFSPTIKIESLPTNFDISSYLSLVNVTNDSNQGLLKNMIKISFNNNLANIPPGYSLYATLYCSEIDEPNNEQIENLPITIKENVSNENFQIQNFKVSTNSKVSYAFEFVSLNRLFDYKLKILIKSNHIDSNKQLTISRVFDQIGNQIIKPSPLVTLFCIDIIVSSKSIEFDLLARKTLQNEFFSNFEKRGCIIVLDENNQELKGYNLGFTKCKQQVSSGEIKNDQNKRNLTTHKYRNLSSENYVYCLKSMYDCPYNPDFIKERLYVDNLFKNTSTGSASGSNSNNLPKLFRRNMQSSYKSKFSSLMPSNLQNNMLDYRIVIANTDFTVIKESFYVKNNSDYIVDDGKILIKFDLKYTSNDIGVICNLIINEESATEGKHPTREEILKCSSQKIVDCSIKEIVITVNSTSYEKLISKSRLENNKSYFVWMTCRENIAISNNNSSPIMIHTFIPNIIETSKNDTNIDIPCNIMNRLFPSCCTYGINLNNINECSLNEIFIKIKSSILILIAIIFLL